MQYHTDLSSLPHFAGDSRILKRNVVSLPHANIFRNLPHFSFCNYFSSICLKFGKFSNIPVFAVYSFLLLFFPFFGIPDSTQFWQPSLFFFYDGESQKQRWLTLQRDQRRQKSSRDFSSIKQNTTQLGFLKKI